MSLYEIQVNWKKKCCYDKAIQMRGNCNKEDLKNLKKKVYYRLCWCSVLFVLCWQIMDFNQIVDCRKRDFVSFFYVKPAMSDKRLFESKVKIWRGL